MHKNNNVRKEEANKVKERNKQEEKCKKTEN